MDIQSIITAVVSAALSISTVGAVVIKAANKSKKYILLAQSAISTLKDVRDALEDGTLTAAEQAQLSADVKSFEEILKAP